MKVGTLSSPLSNQRTPSTVASENTDLASPAPPTLSDEVVAVVSGSHAHLWDKEGEAVNADGEQSSDHVSIAKKIKNFLLPSDMNSVSADYLHFRKWHALSSASESALTVLGTQGVVMGLASALQAGIPFVGGIVATLGLTGLVTYSLKDGLDFVGTLVGGNMAKRADADPARWLKISSNVSAAAAAVQSGLIAMPGAFLVLAPLTSLTRAWASSLRGAAGSKVDYHQAKQGIAEMNGKNKNQDLISSSIGAALGAICSIAGHALLIPVLGPFAPLAVVPLALAINHYANKKMVSVLNFDDMTQTNVSKVAHHLLAEDEILAPKDMTGKDAALPKRQAEVVLGSDGASVFRNPKHRDHVLDTYGSLPYLVDFDGKNVQVTLRNGVTQKDVLRATWQGQLMSDVVGSDGYQKRQEKVGIVKASEEASSLTLSLTGQLGDQIKAMSQQGWDVSDNQIHTPNTRVDWKEHQASAPIPDGTYDDLRKFMKSGEVPEWLHSEVPAAA